MTYADKDGMGIFPLGPGKSPRAHESLNVLITFEAEGMIPGATGVSEEASLCRLTGSGVTAGVTVPQPPLFRTIPGWEGWWR